MNKFDQGLRSVYKTSPNVESELTPPQNHLKTAQNDF